jgi:integrase
MSVFKIPSEPLQCGSTVTQSVGLKSCVQFYPAVLKFSPNPTLGWHIEYYAGSGDGAKLVRYRVRLNLIKRRYRLMSEFYEYAHALVAEVNSALRQGWIPNHDDLTSLKGTAVGSVPKALMSMPSRYVPSTENVPTTEQTSTHVYVSMINELQKEVSALKEIIASSSVTPPPVVEQTAQEQPVEVEFVPSVPTKAEPEPSSDGIMLVELIDRFIAAKESNVRKDTIRSYSNNAKLFKAYLNEFLPGIKAQDFSRSDAQAYLAYRDEEARKLKSKRGDQTDTSARTINNIIKGHRLFFAWGIEEELITNNPFAQLKLQRNEEKRRDLVTDEALEKIKEYLTTYNQKGFLLVCMLVYSGFIRPKEIRELRIRDIHIKDHCIIVPPEVSKNHCSRVVGITAEIEQLMLDLHIGTLPFDYYICGKDLVPNSIGAPVALYSKAWVEMRKTLNLPETMQLYSLKDTGITNMLENGVPAIDVMKQAGHHDLSMTSRYANHKDTRIAEKMYKNNLSFGGENSVNKF